MTVLVTGGSGVVGAAVVRHLVAEEREVRALSRSDKADAKLAQLGAIPVRGDVLDPVTLPAAMAGCDVVYHVAGVNQMCVRNPEFMFRVNREGSLNVLHASDATGVRKMVYTSSAAAIGEPAGERGHEEATHRGYYHSNYERSKHEAELAVLKETTEVELVVVNPSSVQGPGRATGTGKLILDLLRGKLPALVDTTLSIVDIDDCATGHLLAEKFGRPRERYVLNSFTLEMRDAVEILEAALGRPVGARFLPGRLARLGGGLVEYGARLVGKEPPICREMVATMLHGHRYDGSKAAAEFGLVYTSPEDLLHRLVSWFRSEGLLE